MAIEDFDEYIKQSEPHKREKGYAWQTAILLKRHLPLHWLV